MNFESHLSSKKLSNLILILT